MTTTQNGRPEANGAAGEQVGETTGSVPRAWHEQAATSQPAPRRPEPYSSPTNGTTLGVAERDVLGRWTA